MRLAKRRKLGIAFAERLIKVRCQSRQGFDGNNLLEPDGWTDSLLFGFRGGEETNVTSPWRKAVLLAFFLVAFSGLFFRLFNLQVVQGQDMRDLADSNRIKVKIIHAPRGVIYDRNGHILAQNDPAFRLMETSPSGETIVQKISREQAIQMEVDNNPRYKDLELDSVRSYPYGALTAQIVGYTGEVTKEELSDPNFQGYKLGDEVGHSGVEETYEKVLRGVDGGEITEVDAQGNPVVRVLGKIDPIPGQNIYLTIDVNLQKVADEQLKKSLQANKSCCGVVIASNPKNGEILSLVSEPSYDPSNIPQALSDPNSPLLDRAISGTYPPGSTFKIVSSLAGLSSGKITPFTTFDDNGVMQLGPYKFTNWYFTEYGKTEGPVNLEKALKRSNDIYFYHLGQLVGEGNLGQTARELGFGSLTGIDITGEVTGLIPTDAWKEKHFNRVWYPGDTLHMVIGQGYVLVTPIQMQDVISYIASGGQMFPPRLALKITSPTNELIKQFRYGPSTLKQYSSDEINLIRKGLSEVPLYGGTAWPFFNFPIPTAGKTGTAEFGDPQDRTHGWYISYAPASNPQIATTVLVEAGGEGSNVAAPVAKEIYRWYFSADKSRLVRDISHIATDSAKTLGE